MRHNFLDRWLRYVYQRRVSSGTTASFMKKPFTNDNRWDTETFVSSYLNVPIVLGLYFGFKWIKRTKIVALDELPLLKYIEIAVRNPEPLPKPKTGSRRLNISWG